MQIEDYFEWIKKFKKTVNQKAKMVVELVYQMGGELVMEDVVDSVEETGSTASNTRFNL